MAEAEQAQVIKVARRVYVGNLSWSTTWHSLKDHFKTVGTVRYADVLLEAGGRSKGCGIVEFEDANEAAAAIRELNDSELDGRQIYVREDREDRDLKEYYSQEGGAPPRGGGRGGRSPRGRGGRMGAPGRGRGGRESREDAIQIGRRVYVMGLPEAITWKELKDHFKSAGRVNYAEVLSDQGGASKGCGIVEFSRADEALKAITHLNNTELGGAVIHVREDREDAAGGGGGGGGHAAPAPRAPRDPPKRGLPDAAGRQVVIHGLPWAMDDDGLANLVAEVAPTVHAEIVREGHSQRSKGWGIVAFGTAGEAQACIERFNGMEYEGRMLTAKIDQYA